MVGCFQHFNMFVALNIIILVAISLADIRHGIIYDSLLIILLVIIIVYQPIHLKLSLIILAIGSLLAICNLMGFGDVKLIAIYALFLSYKQLLLLLFIASFLALLIAKKREIKFAPYLSIAIISILVV
ncbi:MAG: prepilin peptidase [Erysipelotrichaceae bacterium]|nr:prepilin peptidase [Erysipelotrichaceae bacterium]